MRLVTRGDLDGLVSAVLLSEVENIEETVLVHPQDIMDRKFEVKAGDVLANLPYHTAASMWFDHHEHTTMPTGKYKGAYALEPSVARVIYKHYGPQKLGRFASLVDETDRYDSAQLSREDILDPKGGIMLGFLIDPRTGMGLKYREFFADMAARLRGDDVKTILASPDMAALIARYREGVKQYHDFLLANTDIDGNVALTDFRGLESVPVGNRFLVYTTFPHCNVSVRVQWGPRREFVAVNIGHSIIDRSCQTDVGALCREYGGGGHRGAGACVLSPDTADLEIHEIVESLIEGD